MYDAWRDKWRMFGDISQETSIDVSALMWCRDAILAITRTWTRVDVPPVNEVR